MTNLHDLLQLATQQLSSVSDTPRLDAEILLSHLLKKNRSYLYSHPEVTPSPTLIKSFTEQLNKRLTGYPIAYLIEEKEFWSMRLKVTPATLIPRPDTERLVEVTLSLIDVYGYQSLLDLGTGSGAIALAIAKERPHCAIDACDWQQEALAVARENAQQWGLTQIRFVHSDWFKNLGTKHYDLIVSNPPYIEAHDHHLKEGDVQFEPLWALASGPDGLDDLRLIIDDAPNHLKRGGRLLLEHGYQQKDAVVQLLTARGFDEIQTWQDIQGHDRVSGGRWVGGV